MGKEPIKLLGGEMDLETGEAEFEQMDEIECKKANANPPIEVINGHIKIASGKMKVGDAWLVEYLDMKLIVEKSEEGIVEISEVVEPRS